MAEGHSITAGGRVRCLARDLEQGPQYGWLGTVVEVQHDEGLFIVGIVWDELRASRAARRRQGGVPLHMWAFESEQLAIEFLEVLPGATGVKSGLRA